MPEPTSTDTERSSSMSLAWQRTLAEMARTDPNLRFTTLAHRLNAETLRVAFRRLNRQAAPGPDGLTVEDYERGLEERLRDLHHRLRTGRYRASPARRVLIPKANGKMRPLGIANVEDRVVQTAVALVLEPIYEQDFLELSYGFRPGRSAKDALEVLRQTIDKGPIHVVFEADIRGFFDHLDHAWLRKFLGHRIADRGLLRVIGKVLKSGVEEDGVVHRSKKGCPQGGPLSPLLANIYLHYVLDLWFQRRFRRSCRGEAHLVRYADDFVVCFELREDAERFRVELDERLRAFELELHPDKTRLIEFGTDLDKQGPGPGSGGHTFDFLGFTHYMRRRPKGRLRTARKPSKKSRLRFLAEVKLWLRKHMHSSPWFHQRALTAKLRGFYTYFRLRHCAPALWHVRHQVIRAWVRTLWRRSQKARRLSWVRLKRKPWFKLPRVSTRRSNKRKTSRASRAKTRTERVSPTGPAQLHLFEPTP